MRHAYQLLQSAKTGAERKRMIEALQSRSRHCIRRFRMMQNVRRMCEPLYSQQRPVSVMWQGRREHICRLCGIGSPGIVAIGRVGIIVPTGIATDDTTKYFFQDIVDKAA